MEQQEPIASLEKLISEVERPLWRRAAEARLLELRVEASTWKETAAIMERKVDSLLLQNRELQKKLAQVIEITQERVTVFTETWNVTHGVGADARLECTTKLLAKFKALIEQPIEKVKCEHDWNQSQFDLMCIKCGVIVAIQDHKTLKPKCACPGLPKHLPGCGTTITVTEAALKRNEGA